MPLTVRNVGLHATSPLGAPHIYLTILLLLCTATRVDLFFTRYRIGGALVSNLQKTSVQYVPALDLPWYGRLNGWCLQRFDREFGYSVPQAESHELPISLEGGVSIATKTPCFRERSGPGKITGRK